MEVNIIKQDSSRVPRAFLISWFGELLKELKKQKKIKNKLLLKAEEISFVFLDEKEIKGLNLRYRGIKKPTDVLSFDGDGLIMFGELIFCYSIIQKKAKQLKLPVRAYLCFLLTHGVLHLLGYEHENSKEKEQEMFAFQDMLFKKVAAKLAPKAKNDFHISVTH